MDDETSTSFPARPAIRYVPVGVVRNGNRDGVWSEKLSSLSWEARAERMRQQRQKASEIVVDPAVEAALDGIDRFSHLMIVYWPHLLPEERRHPLRVRPMGNPAFPLVGVFATHSPGRPNPILITIVRLIGREGNILRVTGLDALDGSPVLDIKPYLPERDIGDVHVPDWMKTLRREFGKNEGGRFADKP